jgi:hypothetical protein
MQLISFKNTVLLKRGIWVSAAALVAYAAAPSMLNGELWRQPLVSLIPLCILGLFFVYFLRKTAFHRVADQVLDCIDHLEVRKGRTDQMISFADIASVEVSTHFGMHWITVRLRRPPTKLGDRIDFLPQASLWGNLAAIQQVAARLTARAQQARGADP